MIKCYCDGSCKPNPGLSAVGLVILKDDEVLVSEGVFIGDGTNNIAELTAVELVLKNLKELNLQNEEIEISTDSQYAIGLFTKNWKAKMNTALVNKIRQDLTHFPKLTFCWVRGHNGDYYNEVVDRLANQVIDKIREEK